MREVFAAFVLAMAMAASAVAQEGGTETGPSGTSTGKEAGAQPTPQDCTRGWSPASRWTLMEFRAVCSKQ
jgi:hypothetical protein